MSRLIRSFAVFACLLTLPWLVQAEEYLEGVHYERIEPPQPTATGSKVEVRVVFWYGCPHCYRFEPYMERWLRNKPKEAQLVHMPGIFRPLWELHARAYYTMELLGVVDKLHKPLFDAMHLERRRLDNEQALEDFFAEHGVAREDFRKTFRSFAVETRVRQAKLLTRRYGIDGVPAVIVNGKYRLNNGMTGGPAETLKVINYLVKLESGA